MQQIVIIQTAFLGDLLLSIPLLLKSKQIWPEAKLTLVCRYGLGEFFLKTKLVDQVLEIRKGNSKTYSDAVAAINAGGRVNLLIAPHTSFRTALFCSRIHADRKITFKKPWNFLFFNERLPWPGHLPEAVRQVSLLAKDDVNLANQINSYESGKNFNTKDQNSLLSPVPAWATMSIESRLASLHTPQELQNIPTEAIESLSSNSCVMIFPGSVWETKKWSADGFLQVAELLQQKGYKILWMGGPGEEVLVSDLARRLPGSIELAGKTSILQSCLLMLKCRLVIGNDSASSHMAAATETPVITIMGPTILDFGYRPWTSKAYIIEREGLLCRPCGKHGSKACPIKTHVCMTNISAKQVIHHAEISLQSSPLR